MLKAYPNMTLDYALYELSFTNLRMYGAVLPSYNSKKDKNGKSNSKGVVISGDDPRNKDKINKELELLG